MSRRTLFAVVVATPPWFPSLSAAAVFASLAAPAAAQLTAPPVLLAPPTTAGDPTLDLLDAKWKFAAGLGIAVTSGNSKSSTVNATAEATRITDNSRLNLTGRGLYAKSNSNVTGLNWAVGGQYDRDYDPKHFVFGRYDHLADRPANISGRDSTYLGFGRHMVRTDAITFDISGGLGYTQDKYIREVLIGGSTRDEYGRTEGLLAEASTHKLTQTTTFRQKLGIFPNLKDSGAYRVVFDSGVSVSINSNISLTTGLTYRYDSDPGVDPTGRNLKKGDTLFVTGLSIKFD